MNLELFIRRLLRQKRTFVITCAPTADVIAPNLCTFRFAPLEVGFETLITQDEMLRGAAHDHNARIEFIARAICLPTVDELLLYLTADWTTTRTTIGNRRFSSPHLATTHKTVGTHIPETHLLPFAFKTHNEWHPDMDLERTIQFFD